MCFLLQVKVKEESDPVSQCLTFNSRFTSSLLKVANLLEEGGVCGVPTDTVYALAASCKNPEAIEKIYNIKVSFWKHVQRKYLINSNICLLCDTHWVAV